MHIVFVNRYFHPDHSATSQMLSDLAFFLADGGHAVEVVTSRQRYDDADALLPTNEEMGGVKVHRVDTTRFGRDRLAGRAADYASFYVAAGRRLGRIARRGTIIVAKTDPPLISVVASIVARRRGARLVNWVQDVFPEVAVALGMNALRGPQGRALEFLRDRSLRTATANVVVGERMAEVARRSGAADDTLHVIHNWADCSGIRPIDSAANPLRGEWGMNGAFVACYSGNMGRAHEFDTIVGAAAQLAGSDVRFLFIGGGPQRRAVEAAAAARGLANVEFRPYQPRESLSYSLGVGDVHLVSLRPELEGYIFPSKLYGILAAGRPTIFIGARDGEIAKLVEREGIGLAVPQGDPAALRAGLARLQSDRALCAEMGARARRLLGARYDGAIALSRWKAMLEELDGMPPGGTGASQPSPTR
jgi:glycosyltransferase involved in cell wall biosynthesis